MNGELYQLCQLTTAAKSALFGGSEFEYEPIPYENKIEFFSATVSRSAEQIAKPPKAPTGGTNTL